MKSALILSLILLLQFAVSAQTSTVNVGITGSPFDSTFVVQTGITDSFHAGNHPGAGPYQNGEILLCSHATLKYNYTMGTSSGPTFYLEPYAKLIFYGDMADAKIYMKDSAVVDLMGHNIYIAQVKRLSSAAVVNASPTSSYSDSVFATINFTFNLWPGALSPCNNPTALSEYGESESLVLYPNPASSILHVNKNLQGDVELSIFDLAGKKVLNQSIHSQSAIDISRFPQGVYLFEMKGKNTHLHGRFVKE